MEIPSFLSPVSLYSAYLRRCCTTYGLTSQSINIDDDETTIHFWGPTNNQNKQSLVLLHGFGPVCLWQWGPQIQFLSSLFNLYVPDLIFFGKSTTKSPERSETFQAACVAKLMETLGVKKYSVVGTSYGGFVAYHMAKQWPERVEKVVIASSGVNMRRRDCEELVTERAKLERIDELLLPESGSQLRTLMGLVMYRKPNLVIPNFLLNDFVHKLYKEKRKEKQELLEGITLGRDDTVTISPLQQDVLLIWGEHDQIFPLEMGKELKQILGEKARLEVIKTASHVPQLEHPSPFNNMVRGFLCGSSCPV
ncbi:hypothetical protein HS088_TW23G00870 [Tripterygium wilfordii]|uniref:AB hydrolase-1 domain-containing protein n=1 Tax=Tripterygium wilfordii TaxID=458696 RepID=A0A7J7BW64_TRIWF|nr:2-hydroxy-6-oxononadienedioate/2-hydroxy-6-oxononatrienedioate hydrolase [Tripterygium wilfordii]KAF5726129.1 hypothetical protein HS088_TW23G00870 [Tripterygium wilfordii]